MLLAHRYWLLFLAYFLFIILITPDSIAWWYRVSFWLFAIFLFWTAYFWDKGKKNTRKSFQGWLAAVLILLLLSTRIMPFIHWGEAPLGYDTGIYLRAFEQYLAGTKEAGPLSLIVHILSSIGFSVNTILHGFLAFFNILLGLSVYAAAKSVFRNSWVAAAALLIFALSIAEQEAYLWMFYRMMISVMLFMVTTALIARRSWLAILIGGFAGALHPATFLVFGLTYALYTIIIVARGLWRRWKMAASDSVALIKRTIITGVGILILALLVNWRELYGYLPYVTERKLQLANFEPFLSTELTGLYLNLTAFRLSTLFYTPLALLGLWLIAKYLLRSNGQWSLVNGQMFNAWGIIFLFSFFTVTFILILSKLVFYQRYLIILDLLIIIFAAAALAQLVEYFRDTKLGRIMLTIFIMGFSGIILYYSLTREPWILPIELQELKTAARRLEPNAYGMSTDAYYTPWVYGYLTERTIAPGYFINYWSFEEWEKFWYKGTDEERIKLMERYGNNSIYIFVGSKQNENKPMREFLDRYNEKISEHMWRYDASLNL